MIDFVNEFKYDGFGESKFDPPYESPIEEKMAWQICKFLDKKTQLIKQYEVITKLGIYRLDFLLKKGDIAIGIECDGKEFHEQSRDLWRDSLILFNENISDIFRFSGASVNYNTAECIYLISQDYPEFFDDRGLINLNNLVCPQIKEKPEYYDKPRYDITYHFYLDEEDDSEVQVVKGHRIGKPDFPNWKKRAKHVIDGNYRSLKEAMEAYKSDFE